MIVLHECEFVGNLVTLCGDFSFEIEEYEEDLSHPDQLASYTRKAYSAEILPIKAGDTVINRSNLCDLFGTVQVEHWEEIVAESFCG